MLWFYMLTSKSTINFLLPHVGQVKIIAKNFNLPLELVLAVIWQESHGRMDAMRFEPSYFSNKAIRTITPEKFAKYNSISQETEEALQCFSYGLMQIMGVNARKLSYYGHLASLLSTYTSVHLGCELFRIHWINDSDTEDALAIYNGGSCRKSPSGKYNNQEYVDSVLEKLGIIHNTLEPI
jgi:soluble lytic murein transglycosylase-like protein